MSDTNTDNICINIFVISCGILLILYIIKTKNKELIYAQGKFWDKYQIKSNDEKIINTYSKIKKNELKEKSKIRVKGFSKGNGFVKEEHKFPNININTESNNDIKENYLSFEEGQNLQDMMNYASKLDNKNKENYEIISCDSLYNSSTNKEYYITNDKVNQKICNILDE